MKTNPSFDLIRKIKEDAKSNWIASDELLLYSLERRHLDVPFISECPAYTPDQTPEDYFRDNVRLLLIDEISYDVDEEIHLPGVEATLSSMRGRNYSIVFLVQGELSSTRVYAGVSKFLPDAPVPVEAISSLESVLSANFPGSKFKRVSSSPDSEGINILDISHGIRSSQHFGVLSGIPSLKREEEQGIFVQGLERLIRAMRGKTFSWLSIADPIPQEQTQRAINACVDLQSDIHHLVKMQLSEAFSKSKTVQIGLFGMLGSGTSDGKSQSKGGSISKTEQEGTTQNYLENYQRAGELLTVTGAIIGSIIAPGIGTIVGGALGKLAGGLVNSIGAAVTGKNGHSSSHSTSVSETQTWADTTTQAISRQLGGGGFLSGGMSWTHTTTVSAELLNRRLEYAEEVLKKYEERLRNGYILGMWNLGHYFCADDEATYQLGCGVLNSLFSGMDNQFEPPRSIKLPQQSGKSLSFFSNIYFTFSEGRRNDGTRSIQNHPLGIIFNGPATPVNTKELAIALPLATQDVEGVTVSKRAAFGINQRTVANRRKSLTLGRVLDKGVELSSNYNLHLKDLTKHLAVFGLTGSGKTNTMHHLLAQLWKKHRIPFMVIEPAKAEYRALTNLPELRDDLLVISAGVDQATACPLRLNPFDFTPGKDIDLNRVHVLTHIDRLKSTFNSSFPMYASMPYILEEAILQVYRERGWDLGRSLNRYVDIYHENFSAYLPTLPDLMLKVDSIVQSKGYYQEQQMNIQAALRARLSSLMVGAKGSMFNCRCSIPAEELWRRPVVVELDNMGDDDEKAFLMGLLVSKLYEYRKATFEPSESGVEGPKHLLVIEEAHRLLSNVPESSQSMETANVKAKAVSSFIDMLSEIRALGQSVTIVDQLPSRVSPNIVKGTGAKIIHRLLAKDDREAVGYTMGLTDKQIEDLCLLHTGECIVNQDGDSKSFMCRVPRNDNHARVTGDLTGATLSYKQRNQQLLSAPEDMIDKEDERIGLPIHIAMMAIACGQPSEDLSTVLNCLSDDSADAEVLFDYYWKSISQTIWNTHQGNYRDFVRLQELGQRVQREKSAVDAYRKAAKSYFGTPRNYAFCKSGVYEGILFSNLLEKLKIYTYLDRYSNGTHEQGLNRLIFAFQRVMPLLDMLGVKLHRDVVKGIVAHILATIGSSVSAEEIMRHLSVD